MKELNPLIEGFSEVLETKTFLGFIEDLLFSEGAQRVIKCEKTEGSLVKVYVEKEEAIFSENKRKLNPVFYCKLKRFHGEKCMKEILRLSGKYRFVVNKEEIDYIISLIQFLIFNKESFAFVFSCLEDKVVFEIFREGKR